MKTESLSDFFREKRAHAGTADMNWEKKKEEWIAAIEELYVSIQNDFLAASIRNGSVSVEYRDKSISEEPIGTYTVRELVLRTGEEIVVFSPKGRNVVGATGRVDLVGDMGEATLVLQAGPRWALVAQRTPTVKTVPLNEESLLQALRDVMRP